jgi:hypothetical protein
VRCDDGDQVGYSFNRLEQPSCTSRHKGDHRWIGNPTPTAAYSRWLVDLEPFGGCASSAHCRGELLANHVNYTSAWRPRTMQPGLGLQIKSNTRRTDHVLKMVEDSKRTQTCQNKTWHIAKVPSWFRISGWYIHTYILSTRDQGRYGICRPSQSRV